MHQIKKKKIRAGLGIWRSISYDTYDYDYDLQIIKNYL